MKKNLLIIVPGFDLNSPKLKEPLPNLHPANKKDYCYTAKRKKQTPLKK